MHGLYPALPEASSAGLKLAGSRKAAARSELDSAAMPQVITAETTGLSVQ